MHFAATLLCPLSLPTGASRIIKVDMCVYVCTLWDIISKNRPNERAGRHLGG